MLEHESLKCLVYADTSILFNEWLKVNSNRTLLPFSLIYFNYFGEVSIMKILTVIQKKTKNYLGGGNAT
ncbi:hypothetical protein ApiMCR8900_00255 [Acinetobacter pittii]|nr:hypothetical protein ApiMCR8900_00255 [Acinetobacter pittii]